MDRPARPNPLHVLLIDFVAGTVTRYARHRGLWKHKRLQHAHLVVPENLRDAAGVCAPALEHYRLTGRAE